MSSAMVVVMNALRLGFRLPAFLAFLVVSLATLLVLRLLDFPRHRPIARAPFSRVYFRVFCRLLGFTLRRHGRPIEGAGLIVSNHISWTDIPVLGSCTPVRFLAKAEVADWPVIGWIARNIGTLFIKRASGKSQEVRHRIGEKLRQGEQILIFPEGTTTDGRQVLRFRSPLPGAAVDAGQPVQAVTLRYWRDGQPDTLVPFIGDDDFPRHLLRLLSKPAVEVDILFHTAITVTDDTRTQDLATRLHAQTSAGLGTFGQPQAGSETPAMAYQAQQDLP